MAQDKLAQVNIDNSNPTAYPDGQIRDNDGSDNGTPVARVTMSDQFEFFAKLMRLAGLTFNDQYDNETNGYQYVQALAALAGKNDYVYALNSALITPSVGSPFQAVTIPTDISILNIGEILIGQATVDYASEAKIVKEGTDTPVKTIASANAYKAGDYILLVNTISGVVITQLVTGTNLNSLATALFYLKAASNAQSIDGTTTSAAITPDGLLYALEYFINGAGSTPLLATTSINGLLSAADKLAIDSFNTPVKNVGWASGIEVAGNTIGSLLPVSGDITRCEAMGQDAATPKAQEYKITFLNTMANVNYFVQFSFESLQATSNADASVYTPVFRNKTTTTCTFILREGVAFAQNLKIHFQIIQIS